MERLAQVGASPKLATARLLPSVSPRLALALAALVLVTGLLPVVIIVATGILVGSVPGALAEGLGSEAGRSLLLGLGALGGSFLFLQTASVGRAAVASALGLKLNLHLEQRVMAAVVAPPWLGHLEDPGMLDRIAAAQNVSFGGYQPRDAVPAMPAKVSSWLQGLGAVAVLMGFRWWLAVLLIGAWSWRAREVKRGYMQTTRVAAKRSAPARRSEYLRDLVLTPAAAKEIRVFGLTDWLVGRFRAETTRVLGEAWQERARRRPARTAASLLSVAASLLAYVLLGVAAARGDLDLRSLALYASAVAAVATVVHAGVDNLLLEYGTAPVPAVSALEAATRGSEEGGRPPPKDAPRGAICFEGVTFRYAGAAEAAVSHLDLTLPAGCSAAIVGANGAGKTTLVKLLCRFYEPDGGRITVDGEDLAAFEPRAWHGRIAVVFQDFVRYPLSVADNISFGSIDHTDDREGVVEAARRAGLLATVEALPRGFDTILAPHHPEGVDLSGGEWQRIALARALFAGQAGARGR